jgi:hypothetical protein
VAKKSRETDPANYLLIEFTGDLSALPGAADAFKAVGITSISNGKFYCTLELEKLPNHPSLRIKIHSPNAKSLAEESFKIAAGKILVGQ